MYKFLNKFLLVHQSVSQQSAVEKWGVDPPTPTRGTRFSLLNGEWARAVEMGAGMEAETALTAETGYGDGGGERDGERASEGGMPHALPCARCHPPRRVAVPTPKVVR